MRAREVTKLREFISSEVSEVTKTKLREVKKCKRRSYAKLRFDKK